MKKILLLVTLVSVLSGCTLIKNSSSKNNEVIVKKKEGQVDRSPVIKKMDDNLFMLQTVDGEAIVEKKYSFLSHPKEGVLFFKINKKDKFGLMNDKGEVIKEPFLDFVYGYNNGIAIVKIADYFRLIDTNGEYLSKEKYHKIRHIEKKKYEVTYGDLTTEEIDLGGN